MTDPLGTALGVVGLIAAFKGPVDGYLLIEAFFDADTRSGYLYLRYHIKRHKLGIWGDFFKTLDLATCTLVKQPDVVKRLILRILGEIKKTHEDAEPFIKKHYLSEAKIPVGDVDKSLQANSKMAQHIAMAALQRKTKGRINWIIRKKDKFAELVTRLQQLNRDLYDIGTKSPFFLRPSSDQGHKLRSNVTRSQGTEPTAAGPIRVTHGTPTKDCYRRENRSDSYTKREPRAQGHKMDHCLI